jgi:phosphatidylserine/phosphatidylglycerophosphate/cardiolipin synthase-like enzyme
MLRILTALQHAAARGVKITILLNKPDKPRRPGPGHGALAKFLNHANVRILHHTRQEILHIKAACADQHQLIIGSHNFSQASFSSSRNISVLIQDPHTVRLFLEIAKPLVDKATDGAT